MGQYFRIVNQDKEEYLNPWEAGTGAKLWEICANNLGRILPFLLRKSNEGGGGDIQKDYETAGRWAGDRVVVVGDYDESGLYQETERYTDITRKSVKEFNDFIGLEDHKIR